ncbi:hypothetical protein GGE65_007046 [Skermanella aerolata]|uniref:hypothetical protein n=1 Tax=Skermanella aerolata TaxID=393310 RepID=UPI003D25677F
MEPDVYGGVMFWSGELTKHIFDLSPVWCEYYAPWELDELERRGVDREWALNFFLSAIEASDHRHPYYSVEPNGPIPEKEFVFAACKIDTKSRHQLKGYLTIVQGEITSATIFLEKAEIDLYRSPICAEDNDRAIAVLGQALGVGLGEILPFRYKTRIVSSDAELMAGRLTFPTGRSSAGNKEEEGDDGRGPPFV